MGQDIIQVLMMEKCNFQNFGQNYLYLKGLVGFLSRLRLGIIISAVGL